MNHKKMRERGFTLVETIITLVIVAIMATMLFTYSGTNFTASVNPIQWVESANSIHQIMERITADYQGYPRWKPNTAYATTDRVTPIKRNGYFYQPIAGCTSGAAEPSPWTTVNNTTSTDTPASGGGNSCTWRLIYQLVTNPYPNPIMPLDVLRRKIAGLAAVGAALPIYGGREGPQPVYYNNYSTVTVPPTAMQYIIIENRYISPSTSWDTEIAPPGTAPKYLKVTIQAVTSSKEKLTAIFTE
jgi:prepilin-type N-terminal cleavage/methylation domain-containing protein